MSKPAPTLADSLLRLTFTPTHRRLDKYDRLRTDLLAARRFVLDEAASSFMADLAYASLKTTGTAHGATRLLDSMRVLSRLPHRITWIEFDLRARARRAEAEYGARLDPGECPQRCGWLLRQHPQIDTAFRATHCASESGGLPDGAGGFGEVVDAPTSSPLDYAWRADDGPLPWRPMNVCRHAKIDDQVVDSGILTGIMHYRSEQCALVASEVYAESLSMFAVDAVGPKRYLKEMASDLRYLWALLSTINSLPVQVSDVRASKGFVARGRYRKFLDHSTITLTIPASRSARRVAVEAIAIARRRRHTVRGHWRKDRWHPGANVWIAEHERGDASLGFVTHDYRVEHPRENPSPRG